MANLVIPNESKLDWLQAQIDGEPTLQDCVLRLFTSPVTVDQYLTTLELDALEATYPGYVRQPLENWSDAVLIDGNAETEADTVSFQADADTEGNVYGCYATNAIGTRLWGACSFATPVPIPFEAELQIDVAFDLASLFNT